jgi:hypothetical protein
MRIRGNQSGVSKYTVLIILVVLGIGFREGIKYLDVQLDYQSMRDTMQAKAAAAQVFKDDEIRIELENKAVERGLPLKRDNFLIVRDEEKRRMTIKTAWTTEVQYLWGLCGEQCTQKYSFEIVADETYSGR